jgi:hypothetical protein
MRSDLGLAADVDCARGVKRRPRFMSDKLQSVAQVELKVKSSTNQSLSDIESGVALRLPPHSK